MWRNINLPWPTGWRTAHFIDTVKPVSFERNEMKMNLLGIASLRKHHTVNYNGSISFSGHYSEKTLRTIRDQVNAYLRAFRRHDSEASRLTRAKVQEELESARAPSIERRERRRLCAMNAAEAKEQRLQRKQRTREARAERRRQENLEQKFHT